MIIQHTRHLTAVGKQKGTEHMANQPALMIRKNDDGENVLAAGARDFFFLLFSRGKTRCDSELSVLSGVVLENGRRKVRRLESEK